ncbi:hypothetical protein ABZP36_034866 [Zizania latifolia]
MATSRSGITSRTAFASRTARPSRHRRSPRGSMVHMLLGMALVDEWMTLQFTRRHACPVPCGLLHASSLLKARRRGVAKLLGDLRFHGRVHWVWTQAGRARGRAKAKSSGNFWTAAGRVPVSCR